MRHLFFRRIAAAALLCLLLPFPGSSLAGGAWHSLSELQGSEYVLADQDATCEVRMTFLGDCTLGGETSKRSSRLGFVRKIEEYGYEHPFRQLSLLTSADDLTVANLEVVLSDRDLKKVKKKYNFIGPTAYTGILTSGGIDCVTIANNHTHDFGDEGYADTKAALDLAGVAWFGSDSPAVWISDDGIMLGFIGVSYSLTGDRYKRYSQQYQALRDIGCSAVITVMHAGTEYSYDPPDNYQKQIVDRAVGCGTDLIVGHHPHVVQGYTIQDGVPVIYSLGNCSFGGTTHAKDSDALVLQAVMSFENGALVKQELHFYPISITGDSHYNDYSPVFLTGSDAERVLNKLLKSTCFDPGTFDETEGAVVTLYCN